MSPFYVDYNISKDPTSKWGHINSVLGGCEIFRQHYSTQYRWWFVSVLCQELYLTHKIDKFLCFRIWGFPGGSDSKESTCNVGDPGSIPGQEDALEKEIATHSGFLSWRIPWWFMFKIFLLFFLYHGLQHINNIQGGMCSTVHKLLVGTILKAIFNSELWSPKYKFENANKSFE